MQVYNTYNSTCLDQNRGNFQGWQSSFVQVESQPLLHWPSGPSQHRQAIPSVSNKLVNLCCFSEGDGNGLASASVETLA